MREFAPAKINLTLHVSGKRSDGYHLLDSLTAFVDVGDELEVELADALSLTLVGPFADTLKGEDAKDNLVYKAALKLKERFGVTQGARMILHKNLPIGAGLGGGSSDAGAALRALCKLWGISAQETELLDIARGLGSDVAACLLARTLRMEGVGDKVTPVTCHWPDAVLLVNPRQHVATPAVYTQLKGRFSTPATVAWDALGADECVKAIKESRNDLEAPALELCPPIADVLAALKTLEGNVLTRMSGSGATCFALFKTYSQAQSAQDSISAAYPAWWVKAARRFEHDAA